VTAHVVKEKPKRVERALLVRINQTAEDVTISAEMLTELAELVETLGIVVGDQLEIRIRQPQARYYMGEGKAMEVLEIAQSASCDVIIFDNAISPAQQRNWESLGAQKWLVIDRQEVILDIFGDRAQTKEARLQVELARLEYQLPRLKRAWTHLNRQRGGGAIQRDAGETQLELDQRIIRTRIARLKRELTDVIRHREVQRKQRMAVPIPTGAIVGYTNAGKSSLLNALTQSSVLAEDKLFATLDPTSRKLQLPDGGATVVLTDTVGFVRNLPHRLVEAFKATLEEAVVAQFLLHVIDAANPAAAAHAETTQNVLRELGALNKTTVMLLNKCDLPAAQENLPHLKRLFPDSIPISIHNGMGLDVLQQRIKSIIESGLTTLHLVIPHDRYDLVARIHREASVRSEHAEDDGYHLVGIFPDRLLPLLQDYLLSASAS
jgi:GTP-binding protein HflX